MLIGVPKEIKTREYRVAITPGGRAPAGRPRPSRAGRARRRARAAASPTSSTSPPARPSSPAPPTRGARRWSSRSRSRSPAEYGYFREGLILYTYLHLAAEPALTRELAKAKVAAVAYETIETADGRLPLLRPMSEVAGRMAVQVGAIVPGEGARRQGRAAGRRPGHAARARGHPRRRRRRAQRRHHRHRHGRVT